MEQEKIKKFNTSQIVSLTTVSLITCILLQVPLLKAIRKIGNTNSVKLGSVLLLISSILLTFGQNYVVVAFGKIIYEIAITFNDIHKRYKEKVGVILPILLSISILLMILDSFVRKSIEILISMKLYKIIIRGSKV